MWSNFIFGLYSRLESLDCVILTSQPLSRNSIVDCSRVFEYDNTKLAAVKLIIADNRKENTSIAIVGFVFGSTSIRVRFITV